MIENYGHCNGDNDDDDSGDDHYDHYDGYDGHDYVGAEGDVDNDEIT